MNINLIVAALFAALFVWQCAQYRETKWLLASLILWLGFTFNLSSTLPSVYTFSNALYHSHVAIFIGSLIYFINQVRWDKKNRLIRFNPASGPFLPYLAMALVFMHLGFAALSAWVWWLYPAGLTYFAAYSLPQLYLLQPTYFMGMTLSLTGLMMIRARAKNTRALTGTALQCAFLWGFFSTALYIVLDLIYAI
ncbi:hypothetical protein AB8Q18_09760 [Neisseriaceae bacterium CLB008]|nr:hypothetical protein [Neisseriaceae bacterium]